MKSTKKRAHPFLIGLLLGGSTAGVMVLVLYLFVYRVII